MVAATRGIGVIVSGSLSEELLKIRPGKGWLSCAYGSEYGVLILFTGITAIYRYLRVVEKFRLWSMDDSDVERMRFVIHTRTCDKRIQDAISKLNDTTPPFKIMLRGHALSYL